VVVTAVSRTRSELDSLVDEIRSAGGRAVAHAADPGARGAGARGRRPRQGRLRILVNNAVVFTPVAETTDEQWTACWPPT
jgi:NAD(P)-dependent dehydrogenase (short-subunit alcohol dehydrogenase family)